MTNLCKPKSKSSKQANKYQVCVLLSFVEWKTKAIAQREYIYVGTCTSVGMKPGTHHAMPTVLSNVLLHEACLSCFRRGPGNTFYARDVYTLLRYIYCNPSLLPSFFVAYFDFSVFPTLYTYILCYIPVHVDDFQWLILSCRWKIYETRQREREISNVNSPKEIKKEYWKRKKKIWLPSSSEVDTLHKFSSYLVFQT